MRVLFDNCNFSSRSGPNMFGLKLAKQLMNMGHLVVEKHEQPDVNLAFIQSTTSVVPIVQRIDGVWFNTAQNWQSLNAPIIQTYREAKAIIVQSEFDKKLLMSFVDENVFARENVFVINNGTDVDFIESVDPMTVPQLRDVGHVWSCASSWRPHKRLNENLRYFREHAGQRDCFIIAGANPECDRSLIDHRVFFAGDLEYEQLISLYRTSDFFVHLAWLDHNPNVVVDARAAGCHIICASSGGTKEIAGENSTMIEEEEWDCEPTDLYNPPSLDFYRKKRVEAVCSIDIRDVAVRYETVLRRVLGET